VPTSFQYDSSSMVVFLLDPPFYIFVKEIFSMDGSIYLDLDECGGNFEHITQPFVDLMCHQLGVSTRT
jgi:hypothetical protein